jgi:hypothetical protein
MNIQIFIKDILLYYDTPQLFVARDAIGTNYLCMLVEQNEEFDNFACLQMSEQKFNHFSTGHIDLRDVFLSPEIQAFYQVKINDYGLNYYEIETLECEKFPDNWLPDEGVFININQSQQEQSEITVESKEKAKTIVHLNLNPPESSNESRINTLDLSEALICFQTMLKYAYKKSISSLPHTQRKKKNVPENYLLDVFAFAHGSFKVKMQSQSYPNLFGETEVVKALYIVDKLVDNINDVEESIRILSMYKGHFANTYINFLKYIASCKSKLSYSWAFSAIKHPIIKQITSEQAQHLYEIFNQQDELKEETVELIGVFNKIDEKLGKWRLVDQENNVHNGEIGEVDGITLKGIIIGTIPYKLVCIEKIIEVLGTSEEKKSIQMIELSQLKPENKTE